MNILDTNAILRFILQDNQEQATFVEEQMLQNKFLIPIEVITEIVYVLNKVYKVDRESIRQLVCDILYVRNAVIPNMKIVESALQIYAMENLDFVDCILISYAKIEGYQIISFDKKLNKYYNNSNQQTKRE
jgi:predicted nucleic-acid-binding protein